MERPGGQRENVAVHSSHLGYGHNPAVLWVVADRLGQQDGEWAPFRPSPLMRALYPSPSVDTRGTFASTGRHQENGQ
jgi:hypothetical protein